VKKKRHKKADGTMVSGDSIRSVESIEDDRRT
jgi:hypothetical protein